MLSSSNVTETPARSLPFTRILRKIGIDRAIGMTLIGRSWAALSGFINLFLLTRLLSPIQQGFYYTFGSVLGLTVFFELGLSYVLVQFASHERAQLEWSAQGTLEGDETAKLRLASLLRMSLLWYGVVGGLIIAILMPVGLAFFGAHAPHGVSVSWQLPWAWIVLVTGVAMFVCPIYAILEGAGLIAEIMSVQAVQGIVASVFLWTALTHHGGLLAAPLGNSAALLYGLIWLWRRKRKALSDLLTYPARAHAALAPISWKREIWPFQWKIAVSGISGYFIYQLFNPLLFAARGAAAAGRMGLCITVMTAIGTISLAWVTTKSALFGRIIATRDYAQLDRLFFPCLWQSLTLVSLGGASFWTLAWYLHHIHHRLSQRILEPLPLGLLVATVIMNHVIGAQGLYLRSHKQEPLLWLAVAGAICVGLLSVLLVKPLGATGLMFGYFLVTLVVGLGGGTWVFVHKRREWHHQPSSPLVDDTAWPPPPSTVVAEKI